MIVILVSIYFIIMIKHYTSVNSNSVIKPYKVILTQGAILLWYNKGEVYNIISYLFYKIPPI